VKLAELSKGADGAWTFVPDYVPPLLALAAWPALFRSTVDRLRQILHRWQGILSADIETHALSTMKVVRAHDCLRRSHALQWYLTQIDGDSAVGARKVDQGTAAHPFEVFRRIMELYIDIYHYQTISVGTPELLGSLYDHSDIAGCLGPLIEELEKRTMLPEGTAPYVPFMKDGRAAVCRLPPAATTAREVYWLLHRRGGATREKLNGVKLASRPRLEVVYRHALKGIGARRIDNVPFRHDFSPEVEFYQLLPGEEWEHALRDGTIAYFEEGPLADARSYLFWRIG
jgi:type VI secretion system protein ImpJ